MVLSHQCDRICKKHGKTTGLECRGDRGFKLSLYYNEMRTLSGKGVLIVKSYLFLESVLIFLP